MDLKRIFHVCQRSSTVLFSPNLLLWSTDLRDTVLTLTSFQLLYGRLSDVWSRKLVLLASLAIFFIGSLAASLAQTAIQLTVFRAITGIGG